MLEGRKDAKTAVVDLMLRPQRAESEAGDRIGRMGLFGRIREGLTRTTQQIVERFEEIVRRADAPEQRSRPGRRRHGRGARGSC